MGDLLKGVHLLPQSEFEAAVEKNEIDDDVIYVTPEDFSSLAREQAEQIVKNAENIAINKISIENNAAEIEAIKNSSGGQSSDLTDIRNSINEIILRDIGQDSRLDAIEAGKTQIDLLVENVDDAISFSKNEKQKTKNLLGANFYKSGSKFGVNFTVNEDGSITASGTATWNATFTMGVFVLPAGEYFASIRTADGEISTIGKLQWHYGSVYKDVQNQSFTLTETTSGDFQFYIPNGTTINETFYVQLEKGNTMTEYEQYYGEIVHKKEIVDTECIEKIYDKNKSDVNWGYSGGITGQTEITGKDFSRYKKLIVTAFTDSVMFQYPIILENTTYEIVDGYNHAGSGVATSISDISTQYSSQSLVSSDLTKFYHYNVGRKVSGSDEFIYENSSSGYIIIRIEGVVK